MYNEEQKIRFLNSIDLNKYPPNYWERIFERSWAREVKYKKDLYDFNISELTEFFKLIDSKSYKYLNVLRINLTHYVEWALSNALVKDGQNHLLEFTDRLTMSCVSTAKLDGTYITREQLNDLVKAVENYVDKFVFYAIFEGILGKAGEDVLNLKMSDINENNKTARLLNGTVIPVSEYFIELSRMANSQQIYCNAVGNEYTLEETNTIYRSSNVGKKGKDTKMSSKFTAMANVIAKNSALNGYNLSPSSLYKSGLLQMINDLKEENSCTAEEVLYNSDLFEILRNKYKFNEKIRKSFLLNYESYLK